MLAVLEKLGLQRKPYDDRIAGEAVRFIYNNLTTILLSLSVFPAVVVMIFWPHISHTLLLSWGAAAYLITGLRFALVFAYKRLNPPDSEAYKWGAYFALTSVLWGSLLGITGIIFLIPDSIAHQVFILTVVLGLAAGSLAVITYWLPCFLAYVIPSVGIIIAGMLMKGSSEWVSLGLLTMVFLLFLLRLGFTSHKAAIQGISLKFKNLDLIEQLREQKNRAEYANHSKTQFLASASHDLRQPVHALALFADALKYEVSSPKGQNIMTNLTKSIESIDDLLSSLLDISKLDAGVVKVKASDIRLDPILSKIRSEFHNQAINKSIRFQVCDSDLSVRSDPVLLTNLLRNFVSNAFRYTDAGGILVGCRKRGKNAIIEVWDTGLGIPEEEKDKIFNEFYQLNNPERDRNKGLGLGLAICQRLCQLLKHDLSMNSVHGKGSVFRIHLPQAEPSYAETTVRIFPPTLQLESRVIMVVDDEKEILDAMRAVLQAWKCEVLTAASGEEALQMIAQSNAKPELIICDYRLRGHEKGPNVISSVQLALNKRIPGVIVTGDTAPERIREAQTSGHLLLHKPIKPAELYNILQALLADEPEMALQQA